MRFAKGCGVALGLVCSIWLADVRPASALAIAIRAPLDIANPGLVDFQSIDQGVAQVNPLGVLLALTPGYAVTTQATASDLAGVLSGRAGFGLVVDLPTALPAAFAESNVTGTGTIPGNPGDLVVVTISLDLHGRFLSFGGLPAMNLRGTLSVLGVPDGGPTEQVTSSIDWIVPAGLDAVQTTTHAFTGNDPGNVYPAAQPIVTSSHPDALDGQARMSFVATAGDGLFVEADLQGGASPLVVDGVSQEGDGQVDFRNTGVLRITLSNGLPFENPTGVLASGVVVPEPSLAVLLVTGAAALAATSNRRSR